MEHMNKKKRSASSEASPGSYVTHAFKKKHRLVDELFASVRNNEALATLIYSYLPMNDRVRLGEEDKQFYADKDRGEIVGVYGDNYLNIQKALEKVRECVKYESIIDSVKGFGECQTPDYWWWVHEVGTGEVSWAAERLEHIWFDEKLGYDLKAIREHADFGEDQEQVLEGLEFVNDHHRDNQKKLEKLSAAIKKLGPSPPYNKLFDTMEKYSMAYDHFFYPGHACSREHLRPARMLSFRGADGKMVQTVLKACSKCNKVKDGVRDEFCGHCRTTFPVCFDCATKSHPSLGVHTCSHGHCG
jgi:hypothetical protein